MACLPETEEQEKKVGETAGVPEKTGGFATGFLAGIVTALVCVLVFGVGWLTAKGGLLGGAGQNKASEGSAAVLTEKETLYKLNEVQELIDECYLGEIDSEMLASYLFKGIAAGLGDDYANYYSVSELQSVMDSTRGEYYGLGATLSQAFDTGVLSVSEIYEGSPASEGGLQKGDILLELDGTSLEGAQLNDVVTDIKAMEGEFVMKVYRPGQDEELELTLSCGEISLTHVEYRMLENNTGYIRIVEFSENAVVQFQDALKALKEQGMQKLIVDLRNNPGGLLDAVCDILDEILPEGLIVYTEDVSGNREEYFADDKRTVDCEIAVLVNGDSASASEIFAGAVQDYALGPVIGTTTYGKGVVQKTYPLSDGSAFKLTVETYYTPNGQDIDGNGIVPDITVEEAPESDEDEDPVLDKAMEVMNQ